MDPKGLPQLTEWVVDKRGYSLQGFMAANVTVADATALMALYWPKFVEYQGCVFLGFKFSPEGVDRWLERLPGDLRAVESVVNHVHLWDYFTLTSDAEYAALPELAADIAVIWQSAARQAFPEREFDISVSDSAGGNGPTISLVSI
ncbi:hypothetical protein ABZX90_38275 [Streptomyces sp. NPDC002935]|uniref:hypothetical protein n=1 Tax=Streptomyces sp. NPDC002935 TaxID=3154545 RepID=UPI0033AFC4AA